MNNHADNDYDNDQYPWGNSTYDTEDCYGLPWSNGQSVQPRIQKNAAKQPVRAIDADNAVRLSS